MSEAADIAALADSSAWAAATGRLLADLGFSLINSDRPGAPGGSNLLVAFRDRPTLRHFDPEVASHWVAASGRGRIATFDRRSAVPVAVAVSWGSVRIIDRLSIENRFLTFGGTLRAEAIDPSVTVVALRSPGPIVRWGGHSQGADPLAGEIGAFFGRIMVPVDFTPGAEAELAAASPAVLFAAFVRQARGRLAASATFRTTEPGLDRWLTAEATRLAAADPLAWAAAPQLLDDLALGRH